MLNKKNKTVNGLVFAGIAVLVLTGLASEAQANLVDSNSIIKDDIEYYFQTDKSVYNLGETVDMIYRVKNLRDTSITIEFGYLQQCYFEANIGNTKTWGWPIHISPQISIITLQPGQSKQYTKDWDMIGDNGVLIDPGFYDMSGELISAVLKENSTYTIITGHVDVPIEIVPEPATITLLGAGIIGILSYRKRKT